MEEYQQSVITERNELTARLERLKIFIETDERFPNLPYNERTRLQNQLFVMGQYRDILTERIDHFKF